LRRGLGWRLITHSARTVWLHLMNSQIPVDVLHASSVGSICSLDYCHPASLFTSSYLVYSVADVIGKISHVSDVVPVQSLYQTEASNTRTVVLTNLLWVLASATYFSLYVFSIFMVYVSHLIPACGSAGVPSWGLFSGVTERLNLMQTWFVQWVIRNQSLVSSWEHWLRTIEVIAMLLVSLRFLCF
jgi:hypothetical protein